MPWPKLASFPLSGASPPTWIGELDEELEGEELPHADITDIAKIARAAATLLIG